MMYAKLALRNVKRSAKDYLIYVITLILSVGLFYGFMSIASPYYNESLPVKINLEILNKAMRIAVPIVALLVIFLISYVNTYMLRRKQKEFAVQTIIGMEQRAVAFIFFMETMIMGAISIILGILLGIGLSQIVGYIVVQSFEVEWQLYLSLFPDTILFTLLFFGAIFIVMGIRNIRTVRQLKIIDMLHNSQRGNEKFTLYHQLSRWIVIAVITSIAVFGMMFALIMKVSIQPHILWQLITLVIVATLSIVTAIWFYVRLGTLQDNEGISNALLLRLVGTYAALVLIIICFTILSVQQLTDTIEQKKRFQIISKLGVNKADCGRYIRQQMIFKFGLPVMVSLIFSIGTLLFLTLTGYEEYIVYISLNEMLAIFAVVYAAFIGILISYFVSTYYLFKKHMALS